MARDDNTTITIATDVALDTTLSPFAYYDGSGSIVTDWRQNKRVITFSIADFFKLPCENPEGLLIAIKARFRLDGTQIDNSDTISVEFRQEHGEVRIEAYQEMPF